MARFRTRSPADAARFVRSLSERGYTPVEWKRRLVGFLPDADPDTFSVRRSASGEIEVRYYEPDEDARIEACSTPGCDREPRTKGGLCGMCSGYWNEYEKKRRKRRRAA